MNIPFNIPYVLGTEAEVIAEAIATRRLCGDGPFGSRCERILEAMLPNSRVLLATSCTDALEICAALLDIQAGDEIIAPSFTFVSSVNPFVVRGARIRFVDVTYPSLNVSPSSIEAAITPSTKAVVVVNYGGGSVDVAAIRDICDRHQIIMIEDASQSILSSYNNQPLGTFGHLACISFHETKNVHCGEGGALIVNDQSFLERAEIIREKGTNRSKFFRGQVDKYSWVDIGSSHVVSELNSAFLLPQLKHANQIISRRLEIWQRYKDQCENYGIDYIEFTERSAHNGHLFGVFAPNLTSRTECISYLKDCGIQATFHYVPLHTSIMGRKSGSFYGSIENTVIYSDRLIRLPLYPDLKNEDIDYIIESLVSFLNP